MIDTEKPGSPTELVHFGVKGMKWGVHRTAGTHAFKAKHPTAAARKTEILRARGSAEKTRQAYKKEERGSAERKKLKDVHLKSPDTATALRLTRGEKVVFGLLAGVAPVPPVAAGVQVGITARVGRRRALEA